MKAIKIDLAEGGPEGMPVPLSKTDEPRKYYPTITITKEDDHFPKDGKMLVTFHKVSSTEEDRDGKVRYTCRLELREITGLDADKPEEKASNKKTEDALDSIMAEKKKAKETESY